MAKRTLTITAFVVLTVFTRAPGVLAQSAGTAFVPLENTTASVNNAKNNSDQAKQTNSLTGFAFTFGQKTFPVSRAAVDSWQDQTGDSSDVNLSPPPQNLVDSLLAALGQLAPAQDIYSASGSGSNYRLDLIYNYIQTLAPQINQPDIEPVLRIQNNRVTEFTPPQDGETLNTYMSAWDALTALNSGAFSAALSVSQTQPQTQLSQTNNLGINQLIGEGVSSFKGSPNNRRHNIAAGITKFQGIILPQGATFSFDDDLGPVTATAGFLPELVIDDGNTLPELGGGLCQVSTTTFRAAMAAGLPITDRRNHAYAVEYYSPQGTDATIYPDSADLKFVNDTPGAIMIWPYEKDSNTLVFDFYGTNDGRQVTLEKPVVYDRQADGAMKATWTRLVTNAAGVTRTDIFNSNYQPPALFHKTETFVSATGAQTSGLAMPKGN